MTELFLLAVLLGDLVIAPERLIEPPETLLPKHIKTPAPEDARKFCEGEVETAEGRFKWVAYASRLRASRMSEVYTTFLGKKHRVRTDDADIWRAPKRKPTKILSVYSATFAGPWVGRCEMPPKTRSIIESESEARAARASR